MRIFIVRKIKLICYVSSLNVLVKVTSAPSVLSSNPVTPETLLICLRASFSILISSFKKELRSSLTLLILLTVTLNIRVLPAVAGTNCGADLATVWIRLGRDNCWLKALKDRENSRDAIFLSVLKIIVFMKEILFIYFKRLLFLYDVIKL